ncbi:predicted protein [Naegleria gruberi]|uniref:Predicted protein n=1 Tax=Naegleria gruberi TaxID=5762 RepID=D2W0S2_NAEGR|nr:uncharacterized protein NAEGRDRAFT_53793 [Naegleria gruberi]EFC37341.1 predicted protein [Naegleria gruberi]|eukprot:XP_002670085.1 predicted protein [Naegleria gruberi strain NEG-M]
MIDMCMSAVPNIKSGQIQTLTNRIIVEGTNFGLPTNPMAFWDEASTLKQDYPMSNTIPLVRWGEVHSMAFSNLTTVPNRSGKNDTVYYGKGGHSCLLQPKFKTGLIYDKLYISWWYRNNQDPSSEGDSNKFIRIWDEYSGYGTRISWTHMHLTCANGTYWNSWTKYGKINAWNHHEFYADLANDRVIATLNGKTMFNVTCSKDSAQAGRPIFVRLIGFDNGSDHYKNMTTALDSVFIGNSAKRLVLAHVPTFGQIELSEVVPIDEWNSNRIVARWIEGVLDWTKPIYAYVVDENGNFNSQGYLLSVVSENVISSNDNGGILRNCTNCESSGNNMQSFVCLRTFAILMIIIFIFQ